MRQQPFVEPFLYRTHHCIGDAEDENGYHDARQGDRDATNSEAKKQGADIDRDIGGSEPPRR